MTYEIKMRRYKLIICDPYFVGANIRKVRINSIRTDYSDEKLFVVVILVPPTHNLVNYKHYIYNV